VNGKYPFFPLHSPFAHPCESSSSIIVTVSPTFSESSSLFAASYTYNALAFLLCVKLGFLVIGIGGTGFFVVGIGGTAFGVGTALLGSALAGKLLFKSGDGGRFDLPASGVEVIFLPGDGGLALIGVELIFLSGDGGLIFLPGDGGLIFLPGDGGLIFLPGDGGFIFLPGDGGLMFLLGGGLKFLSEGGIW